MTDTDTVTGTVAPEAIESNDVATNTSADAEASKAVLTQEVVNSIVSGRLTKHQKHFEKSFTDLSQKFDALLNEIKAPKKETVEQPKEEKEIQQLKKQLADIQSKYKQAEEIAAKERAEKQDLDLRRKVGDALSKYGIDPKHTKHAVGFLLDVEKAIKFNEDGELVFRGSDDFLDGLKQWARSDDAKIYQAPRGTIGSGDKSISAGQIPRGAVKFSDSQLADLMVQGFKGV